MAYQSQPGGTQTNLIYKSQNLKLPMELYLKKASNVTDDKAS